jgi:signal transduction histidine kinase
VKHQRWVDLVRTTSFRLALLYALLFGGSAAVLFAVIYWVATGAMSGQLDAGLDAERAVFEDRYRTGGIGDLSAAITERLKDPAHPLSYLLQDASGKMLAGNLPVLPSLGVGRSEIEVPPNEPAGNGDYEPRLFRTLGVSLADGSLLVLAQDAHSLDDLREFVMQSFGWGAAATFVLAVLGSMAMSTSVLRRVEAINRASERIIAGDLARRLPTTTGGRGGSGDEFDRLAANLNVMLDRIEGLVQGLRQVSTDIAHDLRTPLGRLRRTLEQARDSAPAEPSSAVVARIDTAIADIDTLLATFGALLRIAQIEAGASRRGFGALDLSAVLETVIEVYASAADEKDQTLRRRISPGISIVGDRALLTQMLANLVENAVRHSPSGANIEVALCTAGPANRPQVTISDDGPGIPEEEREKVFRRFYRLDASRSTPGNGLGLALVAVVCDLHGANIQLLHNAPCGLRVVLNFIETIALPAMAAEYRDGREQEQRRL